MSSVQGLTVPNNINVSIAGRTLKKVDFTITAAQVRDQTPVTVVNAPAGSIVCVDSALTRKGDGPAFVGGGTLNLSDTTTDTVLLTNSALLETNAIAGWTLRTPIEVDAGPPVSGKNSPQEVLATSGSPLVITSTTSFTAGSDITGSIWYYELPVVA